MGSASPHGQRSGMHRFEGVSGVVMDRFVAARLTAVLSIVVFVAFGAVGLYRYLENFNLYRGYLPPSEPPSVVSRGSATSFMLTSPALGGRRQLVDVYLPAGYATHPQRRYPVMFLLHGFPGRPAAFLETVRLGVVEDVLLSRHEVPPFILVMPFGSTGTFTDEEWVNGVGRHQAWETFVSRDLVRAVSARFRTIGSGSARAIAGLSEGGYGALDIALHHPREFRVIESWSGYEQADPIHRIFGTSPALLRHDSPAFTVVRTAPVLRREHAYVWFYTGASDSLHGQNAAFARELARLGVWHRFRVLRGGHDWSLWRGQAANALLAAGRGLGEGACA
jgi:enterochelin esterase-like enzyme